MDINDTRIPADVRAKHAARTRKEKINNGPALAESGLTIVHSNAGPTFGFAGHGSATEYRAVTIAYERINKSHLRISTAVCHKSDAFTKKLGTKIALANFAKGNTIIVPASSHENPAQQLRRMFGYVA